ncbi:GNAT family N-acetyltransferase [Henriciella marina]|uniref:GNAT family N-acetyltransferase n=1 Tax=Henriciella marina TaxID=453851 RepID=UPI00035F70A1|nr:GNAT family N-acetyltransferase [Henriciella marina]
MNIDLPSDMRRAHKRDWQQLGDITAEAFRDDPVNRYLFGTPEGVRAAMRVLARHVYLPAGMCHLIDDKGATMWLPPGAGPAFGLRAQILFALGQLRHGSKGAMKRAMHLSSLMEKHHPIAPHMYLFSIGTTEAARGKGIGKTLLRPVLDACDRDGVPVYLENSNAANHGFYTAHGFEKTAEFNVGEDGPPMAPMWREPHAEA